MTNEHGPGPGDERQHVWDNPRNVKRLFNVFYAACAVVVVLDLVVERHEVHGWERFVEFYPFYGFVGIVLLVLIAKLMRRVLMRPEDYYDAGGRDASSRGGSSRDASSHGASSRDASSRDG